MNKRYWVCPNNDLEAKTIIEMLKRAGESFDVTAQAWGASWGKLEDITNIRMRDREMQGVTPEQELQAQEAIAGLGDLKDRRKYILIDGLQHSKTSTVTDRLYGKYDNLCITSKDGETNFFGDAKIIADLNNKFPGGLSGGQLDQDSGFWGVYADQTQIKAVVLKNIMEKLSKEESIGR